MTILDGWDTDRLENLVSIISGRTFKQAEYSKKGVRLLQIANVSFQEIDWSNITYLPEDYIQRYPKLVLQSGDLVMALNRPILGRRVKFAILSSADCPSILYQRVGKFVIESKKLTRDYLYAFMHTDYFYHELKSRLSGSDQPYINPTELVEILVPLPPLDEQKRIAAILSKADRLQHLRRYARELSDGYLQSVFLEMFGDPVSNPRGWQIRTLSDLKTKFAYGTSEKCYSEPTGLPVLRIPNILGQKIDLSDLKYAELPDKEVTKLRLAAGDLIFVRTNGNSDYVGRCAVFDLDDQYLYASYLIRARLDLEKINPHFLEAYLRTSSGRKAMSPYIRTTAGQSNIGMEGLGQIPTPLPPLPLQQKFAQIVQKYERLRAQQRESERQGEHLFQSLLHRAFRGEI